VHALTNARWTLFSSWFAINFTQVVDLSPRLTYKIRCAVPTSAMKFWVWGVTVYHKLQSKLASISMNINAIKTKFNFSELALKMWSRGVGNSSSYPQFLLTAIIQTNRGFPPNSDSEGKSFFHGCWQSPVYTLKVVTPQRFPLGITV
jgi:hypothetical protein